MENKQNEKTQEVVKDTTPTEQTETVKTEDAGTEGKKPTPKEEGDLVKNARAAANDLRAENDRKERLLAEERQLEAEKTLGGRSGLSASVKPKVLTDTEYAEALERGEVDPLKADGFSH